jgi:predicted Zn-dependent peptidase
MIEAFLDKAYTKHPYKRPVIGYNQDIRNLTTEDVNEFFQTHYAPNNLTIGIVGDVNPNQVKQLAKVYFGKFKNQPQTDEILLVEPPQTATREITLKLPSQPWYLEGYHRPNLNHPDHPVYNIIASLLSDGRTSRLYKSLVEQKKLALNAQGANGFPGDKYPNLVLFYALTSPNHTVEEVAQALSIEIERLKNEPVSQAELDRVKTQARASLLRTLKSNMTMAISLVEYQAKTGNWRNLFEQLDAINNVTAADIQRVAKATFTPENRTVGKILPTETQASSLIN